MALPVEPKRARLGAGPHDLDTEPAEAPPPQAALVAEAAVAPAADGPADAFLVQPPDNASGRFYLFTQVEESGPRRPDRKTPAEVGREGLYKAVVATYAAVFREGHACHTGPSFGKVAQEGHPNSSDPKEKNLHNHAACAFPADHRWRAVEKHLRETQGVKVRGCGAVCSPLA